MVKSSTSGTTVRDHGEPDMATKPIPLGSAPSACTRYSPLASHADDTVYSPVCRSSYTHSSARGARTENRSTMAMSGTDAVSAFSNSSFVTMVMVKVSPATICVCPVTVDVIGSNTPAPLLW